MRWLIVVVLLGACAPLPEQRPSRGLYNDLRKAVEFREGDDWVVDSVEVEDAAAAVMRSVCSAEPEARENLRLWLATRIAAEGGPSRDLYEAEGGMNRRVREVRRLERVRLLLERTEDLSAECPYWLEQDAEFAGIEGNEGRLIFMLETRGGAATLVSDGEVSIGGGGGGRLLPAVGLNGRVSLGVGFEVGADGLLPETETGSRSFEASLAMGVPILLRITDVSRIIDIEVAGTMRFSEQDRLGLRFALGYGLSTPRVSSFMPYGVIWIGYQILPSAKGAPTEHSVWLGTRVGFDWDP